MRRYLYLSILLPLLASPAYAGISNSDLNKQIDATNFLVNDNCSGTRVAPGLILTANHCVAEQFQDVERDKVDEKTGEVQKIKVRVSKPGTVSQLKFVDHGESQRTVFVYTVKAHDPDHDLALVRTISKLADAKSVPVACREPQRLDQVYAIGNTRAILYSSATVGVIASVQRDYRLLGIDGSSGDGIDQPGDNALIQHTAPMGGGNSGGALLNDDGELIGVNVRGYQNVAPLGFAVPLDDVRKFLKDSGVDLPACK